MDDTAQTAIEGIDALLEQERRALLAGELERLADLLTRKEALLGGLAQQTAHDDAALAGLQAKLARNQSLLGSAMTGIRAVADRMGALRRIRESMDTYDRGGRRKPIGRCADGKVERRV